MGSAASKQLAMFAFVFLFLFLFVVVAAVASSVASSTAQSRWTHLRRWGKEQDGNREGDRLRQRVLVPCVVLHLNFCSTEDLLSLATANASP